MDKFVLVATVVGILELVQVTAVLHCIQCDHIDWNETYTFNKARYIYNLLNDKYNPACAQENPRDRNMYEQNYERQQQQEQQQQQQQQQRINWQNYRQRYDVKERFCQVQCTYVFGDAIVYFQPSKESMKLNVHWRSCLNALTAIPDGCYQRDTNNGYADIKVILQQKLQFLGTGVAEVRNFVGTQCYCSRDFCYILQSSTSNNEASSLSLVLAVYVFFIIK